ncbi:Uncharacterised protein [Mycobacterium tuberculosis]|nr:Uncharacterised protein [Mycobacterium tuberculosis]
MIALWADHDIDGAFAADDLAALRLCDAACDRDLHLAAVACSLVLGGAQAAEFRIDLLGCLLANVTGIEDHEVRVINTGRLHESLRRQRVHHALCIVDIHLTAV